MKVKSFCYRSIATLLCIVFLSLSIGGKFCYYNDISKSYAADPFTLTMGGVALEEVFMAIAVAILGYDVAYQYRDELVDAFKKGIAEEIANGNGVTLDNNMLTAYIADAVNPYTTSIPWSDYLDVLSGMGASASQTFDDIKDSLSNTYLKPSAEYLQYVAEFWDDLLSVTTMPNYEEVQQSVAYIEGLSEYLNTRFVDTEIIKKMLAGETYNVDITGIYKESARSTLVYNSNNIEYKGMLCLQINYDTSSNKSSFTPYYWEAVGSFPGCYVADGLITYNKLGESTQYSADSLIKYYDFVKSNIPIFTNYEARKYFLSTGEGLENAINVLTSLDSIAVLGDDIPTVGNWQDLWERLKNPDLPWWWGNTDALANQEALPWFDIPALHDWASDIPDIIDGVIADNPDIPWTDVFDDIIDIPDIIIPDIDFPYNPSIPTDPSKPADPAIPADPTADIPLDLTDELTEVTDYVPTIADSFGDLGNGLKTKFPFSIPWDIYYILNGLATTPKAPYFELPLKVERYGIDETIIVDMSRFQVLSDLSRSIFSMLFMIVLINLTIKVIGSIKEES